MDSAVFKIAFGILWIIYILIRIPYDRKYKKTKKIFSRNLTLDKFSIISLFLGIMLIPFVWIATPILNDFNFEIPDLIRFVGIIIAVFSLVYFNWIHKSLSSNWSPVLEIMENHSLIKSGPFKSIRHPMYLQIIIWTLGQALIISNYIAGFSGIVAWIIFYIIRVPREEKMMKEHFGKEYIDYMRDTNKILPKF